VVERLFQIDPLNWDSTAVTDHPSVRLFCVSETQRKSIKIVDSSEELDSEDLVWLDERLVEYRDVLDYLHDH